MNPQASKTVEGSARRWTQMVLAAGREQARQWGPKEEEWLPASWRPEEVPWEDLESLEQ